MMAVTKRPLNNWQKNVVEPALDPVAAGSAGAIRDVQFEGS